MKPTAKPKRPVGRPRSDGKPQLTKERALSVCLRLIAEHGYAGTGVRMMSEALEVSPASLFNLFGSKEGILSEIIVFAATPSLQFYDQLNQVNAPPTVKLYKSIFEEVIAVASADQDQAGLFYLPELRQPEMAAAQMIREQMIEFYRGLIRGAVKQGDLQVENLTQTAEQVFQLTETAIIGGKELRKIKPAVQAKQTADFCLNALLVDRSELSEIASAASQIKLKIALPGHSSEQ